MSAFASQHGLQLLMGGIILVFAVLALWHWLTLRRRNRQLTIAVNNMAQALCLWSANGKLILCNPRYIEMYDLAPHLATPGSSLRAMLQDRIDARTCSGDPGQYIADLQASIAKGKTVTSVREHKGRHIVIVNQPLGGGGWVATHEDITERRQADRQRITMKEQEARRATIDAALASFRERVESVLSVVGGGVTAMRDIATALFGSSDQTSQRVEAAVQASNEASANVETAAAAAGELSSSIAEISRQLNSTSEVVRVAVKEAESTNSQ